MWYKCNTKEKLVDALHVLLRANRIGNAACSCSDAGAGSPRNKRCHMHFSVDEKCN
jgi:hypothetical protein